MYARKSRRPTMPTVVRLKAADDLDGGAGEAKADGRILVVVRGDEIIGSAAGGEAVLSPETVVIGSTPLGYACLR
jgi:hypothetical protein